MKTIPLTQNKIALVDDADFEKLSKFKWHYAEDTKRGTSGYAKTMNPSKKRAYLWMHKMVLGIGPKQEGDHRDGNKLNNQKSNLRIATQALNTYNKGMHSRNTSGFKGVFRVQRHYGERGVYLWRAAVKYKGRQYSSGYFSNPKMAAIWYDDAAINHFGEFAKTNKSLGLLPNG